MRVGRAPIGVPPVLGQRAVQSRREGVDTRGMSTPAPRLQIKRVALVMGGILLFVGVARTIRPDDTRATEAAGPTPTRAVIGTLVGPRYHVRIMAGEGEPRYTVMSPDGTVLEDDLMAHEVYHFFPDLDVTELHFGGDDTVTGPMMLADPD